MTAARRGSKNWGDGAGRLADIKAAKTPHFRPQQFLLSFQSLVGPFGVCMYEVMSKIKSCFDSCWH